MKSQSRIPKLTEVSFDGAKSWFSEMQNRHLLFHPEDDPSEIVGIKDGELTFSDQEVMQVRDILEKLEMDIGHAMVIEAAYPVFMNAIGNPLDA